LPLRGLACEAIFYKDFGYSDGLIILGKIDGDVDALNASGAVEATIELVKCSSSLRSGSGIPLLKTK
jgi:Cyclophilin-like family